MAIKVAGTTVIDDSRVLQNLGAALTVPNGGTGAATFTAENILVGNGTGAVKLIAPGTSANVLTSNGTHWYSSAPAAGGGSGLFNTSISVAQGYAITTTMANAYAAAATAGYRYILHSVHVTNIDLTSAANVTGQMVGGTGTYSSITFANTVPVPVGSSVELLKKPKILQPGDYVQMQATSSSVLHVTLTLESSTDTKYFGAGVDITTAATFTDLYTMTANSVIESVLLSNDDPTNDVKARVVWTDGSNNVQGYFAFDLIVPSQATVECLETPKFIQSGYKVRVYSNQANRLEAIIAGKTV